MKTKELLFGACLCMFTACNMPEKGMDVDVYLSLIHISEPTRP